MNNKEYLKKKKAKKQQRFKELEEERETEKQKWLAFTTKANTVNGRVGIGTCGISGKPMTEFTSAEKWRKGV
ncbi:hypothetical protein QE152_g28340 [Popillia japonica]|uniref:Uncharacterized protein n=1 Tax=Popillia japonica TaxID=7064 RepID=A0AAW1JK32_POPJA